MKTYTERFWKLYNNQLAKELLGIQAFHDAGYKGKRVSVANTEKCNYKKFDGNIIDITGTRNRNDLTKNHHGDKVVGCQLAVAPESTIYLISSDTIWQDDFVEEAYPIIKDKKISIISTSIAFTDNGKRREVLDDLFDNRNFKLTVCTHNRGWNGSRDYYPKGGYSVSATHLTSIGEWHTPRYAIKGEPYLAYNSYCPIYTPSLRGEDKVHFEEGTSFSTPFFAGMLALVDDFFIDKIGRPLNHKEMTKFILDNKIKTDVMYGKQNEIFVLPKPSDIDIYKYVDKTEKPKPPTEKPPIENGGNNMKEFKDVDKNRWSYKAIEYCVDNGLMKGYSDGTFRPKENVTREELAQVLLNQSK